MLCGSGRVFGIAILVAVFTDQGGYASRRLFSDGFTGAIGAAATLAPLGTVASVGVPLRRASVPGGATPAFS